LYSIHLTWLNVFFRFNDNKTLVFTLKKEQNQILFSKLVLQIYKRFKYIIRWRVRFFINVSYHSSSFSYNIYWSSYIDWLFLIFGINMFLEILKFHLQFQLHYFFITNYAMIIKLIMFYEMQAYMIKQPSYSLCQYYACIYSIPL